MSNQNSSIGFVRTEMLDQQPAPRGEVGVMDEEGTGAQHNLH